MQRLRSVVSAALRRDAVAGSVASLGGGFLLWWALHAQGMTLVHPETSNADAARPVRQDHRRGEHRLLDAG